MHRGQLFPLLNSLLIALVFQAGGFAHAAESDELNSGTVYKQINPDGSVTYSDKPLPDSKEVKVPKGTEYTPPKVPDFTPYSPPKPEKKFEYDVFTLTSPANDESIWDNTGNVTATVSSKPSLRFGHSIEFLLDGKPVAKGGATSHQFLNVDRGTHQITAQIVDQEDQILASSSVTFHMKRHTAGNQ